MFKIILTKRRNSLKKQDAIYQAKIHGFIQTGLLNCTNTGRRTAVQATTAEQDLGFVPF